MKKVLKNISHRILKVSISLLMLIAVFCTAHEIRPASLDITESDNGSLEFRWRQPIKGEYTIAIAPELSSSWLDTDPHRQIITENSLIHLWEIESPDQTLAGQELRIRGLDRTITDVLLTINYISGNNYTHLIKASDPATVIPTEGVGRSSISEYLLLGSLHIWFGIDHLLYVFSLILLVRNIRALVFTITAFTLAHSITLAAAALELVQLRSAPIEAVISLSIVYMAIELIKARREQASLASEHPWLIAFIFGLLHGFGFAGALLDIGLPSDAIATALLFFNLGIEFGQLLFVFIILCCLWTFKKYFPILRTGFQKLGPYAIGSIASLWFIERLLIL